MPDESAVEKEDRDAAAGINRVDGIAVNTDGLDLVEFARALAFASHLVEETPIGVEDTELLQWLVGNDNAAVSRACCIPDVGELRGPGPIRASNPEDRLRVQPPDGFRPGGCRVRNDPNTSAVPNDL